MGRTPGVIDKCQSRSAYKRLTLASWPRCGALGKVWPFIRSQPGPWTNGHNIFYHQPAQPGAPIVRDFGVEATRTFEPAGEVYATET
jgi:hypothetical protein